MKRRHQGARSRFRVALARAGYESVTDAARATGIHRVSLQRLLRDGIRPHTRAGTVAALRAAGLYDLCVKAHA